MLRSQSTISLTHATIPLLRPCMLSDEGPHTLCHYIYVTNAGVYVARHIKNEEEGGGVELHPLNVQFKG